MSREAIGLEAATGRGPGGSGRLFPDATLPTLDGERLPLDRYRGRAPLVLVMLGAGDITAPGPGTALLELLTQVRSEIRAEGGALLAITASDLESAEGEWRWPFPLLLDQEGALHRRVGAVDEADRPTLALFITDRFREIYANLRPEQPGWPASGSDVLEWLTFVEIQCPECNPPEF